MYVVTPVYARYVSSASRRKTRVFKTYSRFPICGRFPFFIIFFIEEIPKTILVITKTRICLHDSHSMGVFGIQAKKRAFLLLKVVKLGKMLSNEKNVKFLPNTLILANISKNKIDVFMCLVKTCHFKQKTRTLFHLKASFEVSQLSRVKMRVFFA